MFWVNAFLCFIPHLVVLMICFKRVDSHLIKESPAMIIPTQIIKKQNFMTKNTAQPKVCAVFILHNKLMKKQRSLQRKKLSRTITQTSMRLIMDCFN